MTIHHLQGKGRVMLYTNDYEVADMRAMFSEHPVLGPALQTLENLIEWTNQNSDGWAYWRKPCQASQKLQAMLSRARDRDRRYFGPSEPEPDWQTEYRAALRPVKAFRTRQGATFRIVEIGETLDPHESLRAAVTLARAALAVADRALTDDDPGRAREAIAAGMVALLEGTKEVTAD